MIIGIGAGHTILKNGSCTSASAIHNEYVEVRKIKDKVIHHLKILGHTVIDCTTKDKTVLTASDDLQNKVNIANKQKLDLFFDIHLNAGGGHGTETYYYNNNSIKGKEFASKVHKNLVALGFKDRGIKTANFYVLKNTIAPAILIEAYFCDSATDCKNANIDKIAKAIVEGITGDLIFLPNTENPKKIYRVIGDGEHLGSYANIDNICNTIKNNLSNYSKLEIMEVK